jgi:hypothetical protein
LATAWTWLKSNATAVILGTLLIVDVAQRSGITLAELNIFALAPGEKLGHQFREPALRALADGFTAASEVLDSGGTVAAADAKLQATYYAEREAAWDKLCKPAFDAVAGPHTGSAEDTFKAATGSTVEQTQALVDLHRGFAKGLTKRWLW